MRSLSGVLVVSLFAAALCPTAATAQTTFRVGASLGAIPTYSKGSNVAYDYKNGVYLVVSAFGNLNGVFVTADGAVGAPFTIQGPYTHFPGVAYSPDLNGGAGGFLVTWHQTVGSGAMVHGKIVNSNGAMHGTMLLISGLVNYVPVTNDWHIRGVGDVNGDGRADLIWQNDTGGLAVWQLNGFNVTAASLLSVPSVADTNWVIAGAGDVDGDGKADLAWRNKVTGAIGVWYMNGSTVMQTKAFSIAAVSDLNWKIDGVGDVNGDTKADLLWLNESTGEVGVWYLDGNVVTGYSFLSIPKVGDLSWAMVGPG